MSSFIFKTIVGNEFDQIAKELGFSDDKTEEKDDNTGMSAEDILSEQNTRKADEKERKVRHAKLEKEREEARQKIRDKYNIPKKDEPGSTRKSTHEPVHSPSQPSTTVENQGFDIVKKTTDVFNGIKQKFGWK